MVDETKLFTLETSFETLLWTHPMRGCWPLMAVDEWQPCLFTFRRR